jgi:hypothetical protein
MHGVHNIKTEKEVHKTVNYFTFNITGTQTVDKFRKIKEFAFGENKYFISLFLVWDFFQKVMEKDDSKILLMSQSKIGKIFWHLAEGFRSSYSNLRQRRV